MQGDTTYFNDLLNEASELDNYFRNKTSPWDSFLDS